MGKVLIGVDFGSFTCNATTSTFTITGTKEMPLNVSGLLLITNVRKNEIIYNFSNPSLGYTSLSTSASNGSITVELAFDMNTASMLSDDPYQIWAWVDDDDIKVNNFREDINAIRHLTEVLVAHTPIPDAFRRARVITDSSSLIGTISTVNSVVSISSISTLSTVTNVSNIGGFNGGSSGFVPSTAQIPIELLMQKIIVT